MKINKNIWYIKLYEFVFTPKQEYNYIKHKYETKLPQSLCSLFWGIILSLLLIIPLYTMTLPYRLVSSFIYPRNTIINFKLSIEKSLVIGVSTVLFIMFNIGFFCFDSMESMDFWGD